MTKHIDSRWACASLREMADHIERSVHPALHEHLRELHAALLELEGHDREAGILRSLFGQLGTALVAQMQFEATVLLPELRTIERARYGEGPWPDQRALPIHACLRKARQGHAQVRALLDVLRSRSAGCPRLSEAARAMDAELERDIRFEEDALFPRGIGLEPHFP
jgi:iron-sulfur cluster repair protein YtfE (RIC family)